MLMGLGMFVFEARRLPFNTLQRQTDWRHAANNRVGLRAHRQYVGPGDDAFTISGTLYPELTDGTLTLDVLRVMGDTGKAWPLVDGTGRVYGLYVIERMSEGKSYFFQDGAARKIEFSVELKRADHGRVDLIGALAKVGRKP